MNRTLLTFAGAALAITLTGSDARATFLDVSLPGSTANDYWANFNGYASDSYGGPHPGNNAWIGSIPSGASTQLTGPAEFIKVSGAGYAAALGPSPQVIYGGSGPGTFRVFDDTPVDDLQTVVFQTKISKWSTQSTELAAAPVLNYNAGAQALAPVVEWLRNESGEIRERVFQWDLSSVGDDIGSFEVVWSTASAHTQIYSLELDQGNTYVAVPEPAGVALLGIGALAALRRRGRRA